MPVRLRLTKTGMKKNPYYRLVVVDSRAPRDGKFIETLGYFNPKDYPDSINLKSERLSYWLNNGAQASNAVKKLIAVKKLSLSAPQQQVDKDTEESTDVTANQEATA